jgi:predicted permease
MDALWRETRLAARALLRSRVFALVSVGTIALGIGATTTVFSLANALLLRPLPIAEPDRVVVVEETRSGWQSRSMGYSSFTPVRFERYQESTRKVFSALAAQRYDEMSLRAVGQATVLTGVVASGSYWDVLGVKPALGRFFAEADEREPVAVISHHLWRTRFGGDPGVLGRTVYLDSRPLSVVGVAPAGFGGTVVAYTADVWVPLGAAGGAGDGVSGEVEGGAPPASLIVFGRLRPGVTEEQARAAVQVAAASNPVEDPKGAVRAVRLERLRGVPGDARMPMAAFLGLLLATALFVLLIASTNVAGMLLARAVARRREMAIRLAVGANRRLLVRQLLAESVLLFVLGGAAGVALAVWLTRMLAALQPPLPVRIVLDLSPDVRVLGFALALALLTGVVFGLAPALQASRTDVLSGLKAGGAGQGTRGSRLRSALVVGQLALAMLLLVVAGLFGRTLQRALGADLGFDPAGVAVARVDLGPHGYDAARGAEFQRRLLERVASAPGVQSAALAGFAPMSGNVISTDVRLPGTAATRRTVDTNVVDPGYFATLRIPLRAGRVFTAADRAGAAPVVVVNETMAARLWPGGSALGKTVRANGADREVVGVVANGSYERFGEEPTSFMYLPVAQAYSPGVTVLARGADAGAALLAIRRELQAMDANVAPEQAMPLSQIVGVSLLPQQLAGFLIGGFGVLGLALAALGIYGVLAYQVGQRTREIGVRVALGARSGDVVRMVVRRGVGLAALGAVIGLTLAFGATRLLATLLYGVSATDPLTFTAVPALLMAVALTASWLPARRAARVDPMVALRAE